MKIWHIVAGAVAFTLLAAAPAASQSVQAESVVTFKDTDKFTLNVKTVRDGFIKVFASGKLAGLGKDHRLVLRINGQSSNYQSFGLMQGHAAAGEWDTTGIYLGRNGWHLDADFSTEITVSVNALSNKVTVHGLSTFAHGSNQVLGYEIHGFWVGNGPVTSVDLQFSDNAVASGFARHYLF
jgi:hypothetical protein